MKYQSRNENENDWGDGSWESGEVGMGEMGMEKVSCGSPELHVEYCVRNRVMRCDGI